MGKSAREREDPLRSPNEIGTIKARILGSRYVRRGREKELERGNLKGKGARKRSLRNRLVKIRVKGEIRRGRRKLQRIRARIRTSTTKKFGRS